MRPLPKFHLCFEKHKEVKYWADGVFLSDHYSLHIRPQRRDTCDKCQLDTEEESLGFFTSADVLLTNALHAHSTAEH